MSRSRVCRIEREEERLDGVTEMPDSAHLAGWKEGCRYLGTAAHPRILYPFPYRTALGWPRR